MNTMKNLPIPDCGFPFQVEECSLGDYPSAPVARAMPDLSLNDEMESVCGSQ
jgi:hypothetical protein